MSNGPLIEVDWTNFSPWRVQAIRHHLVNHPLMQLPALLEFSERQKKSGRIRSHANDADAGTPFDTAPKLHPNRHSVVETLSDLENAQAFMSFLNIQSDTVYRGLVDEVLDDIQPHVEKYDPGLSYRAGWIFVASPRTVTPFHIDREHNFILQFQGRKRIYVWDPNDVVAVSEEARDMFHAAHSRKLICWREALRERAHVFELEPGMGAYMPSTSPHLVENSDNASVTASFTYYTADTRRNSILHTMHHHFRRLGLVPPPVGQNQTRDSVVFNIGRILKGTRALLLRMQGKVTGQPRAHYAAQVKAQP